MGAGELFDTALAGICIGAAVMGAVIFARSPLPPTLRLALVLTCAAGALYFLKDRLLQTVAQHSQALAVALVALSVPAPAFLWIAVRAVFEDRPVGRLAWAAPGALTVLGLATNVPLGPHWRADYGSWAVAVISAALALHGLYVVSHGWRNDLLEGRRRLRGPLLAVFAIAFLVFISGQAVGYAAGFGAPVDWIVHANWIALAGAVGLFATLFDVRRSPFAPPSDRPSQKDASEEEAHLRLLEALMSERQVWRRETLTIGDLAAEMGLAEHRLRRLISTRLGRRNFAAFVNGYRIEEAKRLLSEAADRRRTVAAIAYEVGFASLNPFNRAFKEITGSTPTAWSRRENLVEIQKPALQEENDET